MGAPYLPPSSTNDTVFPRAIKADLRQAIRLIEDLYRRMYTVITYYPLLKAVTSVCDEEGVGSEAPAIIQDDTLVGEMGTTIFDPLWGESVPTSEEATGWEQPHANPTHDATDSRGAFDTGVKIHARVQREAKDRTLKKLGFDKIRDLLIFIPLSMLDNLGIQVEAGDEFDWDGERFKVLQRRRTGYWKNTNIRLYIAINAEHTRLQSS